MAPIDLKCAEKWIGRTEEAEELLSPALVRRFAATLGVKQNTQWNIGDSVPSGIHWCVAPTAVPQSELGPDGHPALGSFLPPLPFGRRMWAGGTVQTVRPFKVGTRVTKRSRVASIELKDGRSGPLCFVAVDHTYADEDGIAITERQDIVYRDQSSPPVSQAGPSAKPLHAPLDDRRAGCWRIETYPTLLFRYSALTFNGHRIHYDLAYARELEGYEGLVVHGPLQATWMHQLATEGLGAPPSTFQFRGIKPLICGEIVKITAKPNAVGGIDLGVEDSSGTKTMAATAHR